MHDPLVVAFTIPRPWPERSAFPATGSRGDQVRWRVRLHHACTSYCRDNDPPHREGAFPLWKPSSYSKFWRLAGADFYWPPLITIWHAEPGGADALSVCQRRWQDAAGRWHLTRSWRWHAWHWHVQVHPAQELRRLLLTRCAWCGGPHRKGDPVNVSLSWDGPRGRWWQGEPGLYHQGCDAAQVAARACICAAPQLGPGGYGTCGRCGKFRGWRRTAAQLARDRKLAGLPAGTRPPGRRR